MTTKKAKSAHEKRWLTYPCVCCDAKVSRIGMLCQMCVAKLNRTMKQLRKQKPANKKGTRAKA